MNETITDLSAIQASVSENAADELAESSQSLVAQFEQSMAVLEGQVAPEQTSEPSTSSDASVLEELADDMLAVTRRLLALEQANAQLYTRIEQADVRAYEMGRAISQQVDLLRRDLIGDKASLLARSLFNSIVSHIDAMVAMRDDLEHGKDRNDKHNKRLARQIEALELSLVTALQGLGYYQFKVSAGEPFNSTRMEALGFDTGAPGSVLRLIRHGFETKDSIMRRAGVVVAKVGT